MPRCCEQGRAGSKENLQDTEPDLPDPLGAPGQPAFRQTPDDQRWKPKPWKRERTHGGLLVPGLGWNRRHPAGREREQLGMADHVRSSATVGCLRHRHTAARSDPRCSRLRGGPTERFHPQSSFLTPKSFKQNSWIGPSCLNASRIHQQGGSSIVSRLWSG